MRNTRLHEELPIRNDIKKIRSKNFEIQVKELRSAQNLFNFFLLCSKQTFQEILSEMEIPSFFLLTSGVFFFFYRNNSNRISTKKLFMDYINT